MSDAALNSVFRLNKAMSNGAVFPADSPGLILPVGAAASIVSIGVQGALTTAHYAPLYKWGAPGGAYQVTAGKTFICSGVYWYNVSVGEGICFGYGDTAVAFDAAGAPTTPVYYATDNTANSLYNDSTTNGGKLWEVVLTFPAGKFPFIQTHSTGATMIHMNGFEF